MLSLQEGVKQIYSQPKSFYFLTGPEYGIKSVYITHLKQYYNNVEEHESLEDLINVLSKKSLIPRELTLYIVRYDKSFISNLKTLSSNLLRLNFQGTIIGVYQDENDESKLDKYFPDNVLRLNYLTKEIFIKNPKTNEWIIQTTSESK